MRRAAESCATKVTFVGAFLAAVAATPAALAVEPHRSEPTLPSSNGRGAIAFDATTFRVSQFLEHAYRYPQAGQESRNFAFDSYTGLRVGASASWLTAVPPIVTEYLAGTGIVHTMRTYAGLTVDEYDFAPILLTENASVMLVRVTRNSGAAAIDAYSLFNYHLGSGAPLPGSDNEQISYDAGRDAFFESGPSGVAFGYGSMGASSSHHGCTPNNPYDSLNAGTNLADDAGTAGPTNDAVAGLQAGLGDLPLGGTGWAGWFTVLAADANAGAAVDRVRTWLAGRSADRVLADEQAAWKSWITAPPSGASALEGALAAQAQVVLRMGQVTEPGAPAGQILASIAPGQWHMSWVRDMAYATIGLVRAGHFAEAKAALAFQMSASVGAYQQYVGVPYQISVVRYFGNSTEESDTNADGPNIEFDGFGLFLWALDEYVRASGDTASLSAWWPSVKTKVADVLVHLQEPTGLIAADSSIWEVHWNGKQRHFGYTTITAANGLCSAARLADKMADAASSNSYLSLGQKARDAVLSSLRAPDGTIAQSPEALAAGSGWLDASEVEAITFGLVDPSRRTARATLASMKSGLVPPSGRGFMRDDLGAWYDSQEWVFVDLRATRALMLQGDTHGASDTLAWNVGQASENFGELSELHDAVTADYAGASPMVGFGAGAYLIALFDRGTSGVATCGAYASEPADPVDGGPEGGASPDAGGAQPDGSTLEGGSGDVDGGGNTVSPFGGPSRSCACTGVGRCGSTGGQAALALAVAALASRRRRRPPRDRALNAEWPKGTPWV